MKTTIELPDALMRDVKLRAVYERRKLKEVVADLLRKGLDTPQPRRNSYQESFLGRDERTGLPLVQCRHAAAPEQRLTPEAVADLLDQQEATWQDEAGRH